MLDQLGDIFGTVGSGRLAKVYDFSESEIKMMNSSNHPGHLLVRTLVRKEHNLQCKESLRKLELHLQQIGLFRASYIISDFVQEVRDLIYSVLP